jgi:hypothetical protein
MPQNSVTKTQSTPAQQLAYLESITQTKLGLTSSSRSLTARRAFADADETRTIDSQLDLNSSEWFRVNAAEIAFYSRDVTFRPPTETELASMRTAVRSLDALIASNSRAHEIINATAALVSQFRATQG